MEKVVVTGANGFIGKTLLQLLNQYGIQTYAIIRNESSNIESISNLDHVRIVYCDMENIVSLPQKIKDKIDVFYHLAWNGSTGNARSNYAVQLQNVKWTVDAVSAAAALGCNRFVGAGTLAEQDINAYIPLDGSVPNPVSCYGSAKLAAHYMSKAECSKYESIAHCWAYLSNTYGIGNYTSNFVNFAAKVMLTGQPANFTAGEQLYDFVAVEDTIQGLYCIGEKGKPNTAYYIGSNHPTKLKNFIEEIRDQIDPNIVLNLGAVPFHGISQPESVFDCTKLMRDTGYSPKISFKQGLQETVPWIKKQIQLGKL